MKKRQLMTFGMGLIALSMVATPSAWAAAEDASFLAEELTPGLDDDSSFPEASAEQERQIDETILALYSALGIEQKRPARQVLLPLRAAAAEESLAPKSEAAGSQAASTYEAMRWRYLRQFGPFWRESRQGILNKAKAMIVECPAGVQSVAEMTNDQSAAKLRAALIVSVMDEIDSLMLKVAQANRQVGAAAAHRRDRLYTIGASWRQKQLEQAKGNACTLMQEAIAAKSHLNWLLSLSLAELSRQHHLFAKAIAVQQKIVKKALDEQTAHIEHEKSQVTALRQTIEATRGHWRKANVAGQLAEVIAEVERQERSSAFLWLKERYRSLGSK